MNKGEPMHPLTAIIAITTLVIQLLLIKNPILVVTSFIVMKVFIIFCGELALVKSTFKYAKWPILLVLLINPLVVSMGDQVLMSATIGPLHVTVSYESLLYSLAMSMKLFMIMMSFQLMGLLVYKEDLFTFMSQHFRQLTLTLSMSSNAVDALRGEYERVQMVMMTRGMPLEHKNFLKRFKRSVYLIKVVLISVLESTFHRSEALYVRHYTKTPGSCYQPLRWSKADSILLGIEGIGILAILFCVFDKNYQYAYYPTFDGVFYWLPLLLMITTLFIIYRGIKEHKNDQKLSFNEHHLYLS
jgi:energy-coupling factor transporter transmembrane protein EcfT